MDVSLIFYSYSLKVNYPLFFIYPVRNNATLEFLTGFTLHLF